jgi:hypothetical protein
VLERVVEKLRAEFIAHGRPEHFEHLKAFLLGQSDVPHATLARDMNTSEGRSRLRFTGSGNGIAILRQEIADTVADATEVDSELRF